MRVLVSLKKAQIFIDALTQVDVIGLLVGTTRLAGVLDGIDLDRTGPCKVEIRQILGVQISIQVKYCRTAVSRRNGGLSTSG